MTLVLSLLCGTRLAYARSYEITRVDIDATVHEDGTITVVEMREFDFDGHFNGVYWEIPEGLYEGREVEVTILYGGIIYNGQLVTYERSDSGDNRTYQVSDHASGKELKIFSRHDDEAVQFVMSYEVTGITSRWADTGELYWKYVSDGWDEESQNVTMTLHLPVPSGQTVTPGENVRAWGHGPLDGEVSFDGNDVVFFSPGVGGSEFAEARVTFPADWLPDESQSSTSKLPSILAEEQAWADEANAQRERARAVVGGGIGVGAAAAIASLVVIARQSLKIKEANRPFFQDEYFRDVPTADHPAVLGALHNGGTVDTAAFTATLMRLTDKKLVTLSRARLTSRGILGREKVDDDYMLTLNEQANQWVSATSSEERLANAIDDSAIDFLFRTCARRAYDMASRGDSEILSTEPPLYFSTMEKVAKRHARAYDSGYTGWSSQVEAAYEQRFKRHGKERVSSVPLYIIFAVDAVVAIVFMFFALVTGISIQVAGGIFAALVLLAIGSAFLGVANQSLNREGIETKTKLKALRRWLKDFTRLNEAIPDDVVLWNRLLVMATALGVAEEVISQLKVALPHVLEDPYMRGVYGWYFYDGTSRTAMAPAAAIHDHVTSAHNITTAKLSSSSFSSGGGGGGGFSGGGGGGFGGGGGGGAF